MLFRSRTFGLKTRLLRPNVPRAAAARLVVGSRCISSLCSAGASPDLGSSKLLLCTPLGLRLACVVLLPDSCSVARPLRACASFSLLAASRLHTSVKVAARHRIAVAHAVDECASSPLRGGTRVLCVTFLGVRR